MIRTRLYVLTCILLGHFTTSVAQELDFNNPPWELACDSATTQIEMNVCSYEKYRIADSILNSYYDTLVHRLDKQIKKVQRSLAIDSNDSYAGESLQHFEKQKAAIIRSKKDFVAYRSSTTEIVDIEYTGGSIRPLSIDSYALGMTVNQIRILANMLNEFAW